jgi:AraC-like DNA-binding protein
MLTARTLLDDEGVTLADVACRHQPGRGNAIELRTSHALVFVRRGGFVRASDGDERLLDPTVAYATTPGQERIDHPLQGGDDCTYLALAPELVAALWGGDPALPARPLPTSPAVDLEHRLLLAAARRGDDRHEVTERALALAAAALERHDADRAGSGRPATARTRRALVDGARERLLADPDQSLPELARRLAVSPHHLSRLFHALTRSTISRHRLRLRVRAALERLAGGERDLARVAAEAGFADQAHCCRVIQAELGTTPSALRAALS